MVLTAPECEMDVLEKEAGRVRKLPEGLLEENRAKFIQEGRFQLGGVHNNVDIDVFINGSGLLIELKRVFV